MSMDALKFTAMAKEAGINSILQEIIWFHLCDCFRRKCYLSRSQIQMVGEGHVEVSCNTFLHKYEEGMDAEMMSILKSMLHMQVVSSLQVARNLLCKDIFQLEVERINLVLGSNSWKKNFQCSMKMIILTATKLFKFEIWTAEINSQKDSADFDKKSIFIDQTNGLNLIAENELVITNNPVNFNFLATTENCTKMIKVNLYVTEDGILHHSTLQRVNIWILVLPSQTVEKEFW